MRRQFWSALTFQRQVDDDSEDGEQRSQLIELLPETAMLGTEERRALVELVSTRANLPVSMR